jgi:hypothetical protein
VKLPRTVLVLGFVSFFNDLASEIVVPLIPILLTSVLGAGPVALGLIEGVADAVAAVLKLWSGRRSDLMGGRRKTLVVAGYALSTLARPLLGLAGSWITVLLLRSVDRVGKGLRTAPRDALVADATAADIRGYAYGFHRALDNAGAVGGSLIAAAVLAFSAVSLPQMILLSAIPGFAAVLCLMLGVREARPAGAGSGSAAHAPTTPPAAQAYQLRPEGAESTYSDGQALASLPPAVTAGGSCRCGAISPCSGCSRWRAHPRPSSCCWRTSGALRLSRCCCCGRCSTSPRLPLPPWAEGLPTDWAVAACF